MASFDPNPLKELLLDEGASLMPYGIEAPEPGTVRAEPAEPSPDVPLLAAAFGPIELEYASLRRDCVIIDRPDRAVIEVSGFDSREFLSRMLTQDVGNLEPGQSCNSFWLNRKGRIDADVRVLRLREFDDSRPPRFFLELERGSVDLTLKTLGSYIITEEVTLTPRHDLHRLSLHGPRARDGLLATSESIANISHLKPNANTWDELADGLGCWIDQHDTCGVPGYEIYAEREVVLRQFRVLLRAGRPDFMTDARGSDDPGARGEALAASKQAREPTSPAPSVERALPASIRLRPAGWFAYNIARIEAGTPLF
ncbi:MAG: hypothetical protein KDA05_09915, partial [Phycisphaerales bacterium]|nr:hypothetical protein [Phycisphaerales bacterium]